MGRISSEQAAKAIGNRYDLILIAARRTRELGRGWQSLVTTDNGAAVTALKEIEQGKIGRNYLYKPNTIARHEKPDR
jgi:DNA-directed RNA polymerase subunit omega